MLEALLIIVAFAVMQWLPSPFGYSIAALLILVSLPGILVMRGAAPFVTTPKKTMDVMLRLAAIKNGERVYDLGCGDGRLVFAAAKEGAFAIGCEMSVPAYAVAKVRSWNHPLSQIRFVNFWHKDYCNADVLFCYFLKDTMHDFEERIWPTLKPGCRVVSHAFAMKNVRESGREGDAVVYIK